MIIQSLKISNILSYKLLEDFDNEPNTIEFKKDLNILIGSNGSGKSNLLEIINKLFQGHFCEYYYIDDNALFSFTEGNKAVKVNQDRKNQIYNTLFKNFDTRDEISLIEVQLSPDKGDIANLEYLVKNIIELKSYYSKYCDNEKMLSALINIKAKNIDKLSSVKYKFQVKNERNQSKIEFGIASGIEDDLHKLFYYYLIYFNQLQTLLQVINLVEDKNWPLLKNPFALISSMRQYGGGLSNSISVGNQLNNQIKSLDQNEGSISAKNYSGTDYIFMITSTRLGQLFRQNMHSYGVKKALDKVNNKDNNLSKINFLLKENLGLVLKLEDHNPGNDTLMSRIYKGTEVINFTELSMGQKSIFYLLFVIYGYDIQNGLLIIDEPELHLHVTMQKKYFRILKEVCKKANIQLIIATHSSVFIDEFTIKNTFRFFKNNNHTSIFCPNSVTHLQKDLIKILTYTNSSRVFFSDNVILIEGDSDEYFFTYFYENHVRKIIKDDREIEILYIGGKGNYKKWAEFLKLFRIKCFFIADFDNIKEFKVLQNLGISYKDLIEKSKTHILSKFKVEKIDKKTTKDGAELLKQIDSIIEKEFVMNVEDKKNLESLWVYLMEKQGLKRNHIIDYLKEKDSQLFNNLIKEIEKLYDEGVFILKDGDLEDYLDLPKVKDLTNVIAFCQNDFNNWIQAKGNSAKLKELNNIFQTILSEK